MLSQAGYNYSAAKNHLIIDSDFPLWKVASIGTFAITISAGNTYGSTSITHSLGYKPQAMVFSERVNDAGTKETEYRRYSWESYRGLQIYEQARAVSQLNTLEIYYDTGDQTSGYTINGFYVIFYDPIA